VRRSKIGTIWPLMAADQKQDADIRKFEEIGTHPAANHNAIAEALVFHHGIGSARKAARLRYLRDRFMRRLAAQPRVRVHTSFDPAMSCGIGNLQVEGIDSTALGKYLFDKHRIIVVPIKHAEFEGLRDAIEKLALNDASFSHEMETSAALGFGFRCGFLGLLHLEVVRDRLEREYLIDLITTAPSVIYMVHLTDGGVREVHNPADMPDPVRVDHIEEPWIKATILVPDEYLGDVLKLCQDRRGVQQDLTYAGARAMLVYRLPLNEVVFDFYDKLKSVSRGYASFDYQLDGYEPGNLVKMQILVNEEPVDALSVIVHRDKAELRGRSMCEKLKELIPQHMFKVPIQAAIGGRVVARETISALRKDVTAKCYGGDVTRKRKLLDKQKAGKKKMRQFGRVEIPQEAFINALKMDG